MEPFIGQIQMFGFNFPPRGWAFCDGQLLPISQYSALFSLLGTMYGGDGRTTFALPDLRGRVAIHPGHGPGLSDYRVGQKGGVETVTLNITQIPSHNHIATGTPRVNSQSGQQDSPEGAVPAVATQDTYTDAANANGLANSVTVTVGNEGGSQPHTNIQPYLGIYHSIALQGIFPSRG
ncbi:MAG: phage tail protein [Bacteroidia bacterium]|nr:phage tail protein [Bacteroidia bacterium]